MIQVNKHPAGRANNMVFGAAQIADGFVRLASFGFLHSTFALDWSRHTAKVAIIKMKKSHQ